MPCCRLRIEAYNGFYHYLPFLITDLNAQPMGYATAEPCMDSFLYQIEHINETVIALPPQMAVSNSLTYQSRPCFSSAYVKMFVALHLSARPHACNSTQGDATMFVPDMDSVWEIACPFLPLSHLLLL